MFRCKWVNLSGGRVQVHPQYGMTTADLKNLGYTDEPFILANDVAQVIYVKDMSTRSRKRKDKEANTSYDEPNTTRKTPTNGAPSMAINGASVVRH